MARRSSNNNNNNNGDNDDEHERTSLLASSSAPPTSTSTLPPFRARSNTGGSGGSGTRTTLTDAALVAITSNARRLADDEDKEGGTRARTRTRTMLTTMMIWATMRPSMKTSRVPTTWSTYQHVLRHLMKVLMPRHAVLRPLQTSPPLLLQLLQHGRYPETKSRRRKLDNNDGAERPCSRFHVRSPIQRLSPVKMAPPPVRRYHLPTGYCSHLRFVWRGYSSLYSFWVRRYCWRWGPTLRDHPNVLRGNTFCWNRK